MHFKKLTSLFNGWAQQTIGFDQDCTKGPRFYDFPCRRRCCTPLACCTAQRNSLAGPNATARGTRGRFGSTPSQ